MALLAPETVTTPTPEQGESYYSLNQWAPGAAPTVNDDETAGFTAGSFWFYSGSLYVCTDPTATAAVWNEIRADEIAVDTTAVTGGTAGYLLYHKIGDLVGEIPADLADPNADRIAFWDDSAGKLTWLALGTNLSITGTTLDAASGGGMTIGNAVTGGGANRVLYEDGSQNLATTSRFTFDGQTLKTQAENSSQTADIFQAIRYDGAVALRVDDDTSVTLGGSYDYANGKHAAQHIIQYAGAAFSGKGLKLMDVALGSTIRLHAYGGDLWVTDDTGGVKAFMGDIGAASGYYIKNNGATWNMLNASLGVGANSTGLARLEVTATSEQLRLLYDASNYFKTTVSSTGGVTFDAVGSGAGFTFSDDVTLADAKNLIFNTTTGTKIGTATTQKLGFFNATPIARPASAGAITDSIGGGSAGGTITSVTGADTVDLNKLEDVLSTLALTINDIRSKLVDLGLIS